MAIFYALLGGFLGLLVFLFAFGGDDFIFTGHRVGFWCGPFGLLVCSGVGLVLGALSYRYRSREFGSSRGMFQKQAEALLFTKRLMVTVGCVAAMYYIWELARSLH
jgi:hypothetical protein